MKKIILGLVLGYLFIFFPSPSLALEIKSGDNIDIPASASISGSLAAAGRNLNISGTIDGDLYCVGQRIKITAAVKGDIICAGQNMEIDSSVSGSLRLAGQNIIYRGTVGRNVTLVGQAVSFNDTSRVGGEMFAAGQTLNLGGNYAGDVYTAGQDIILSGLFGKNAFVNGQTLGLSGNARISGDLDYRGEKKLNISDSATVSGKINENILPADKSSGKELSANRQTWAQKLIGALIMNLIFAWLTVLILPVLTKKTAEQISLQPGKSLGLGFLAVCLLPMAIILLVITIIGIPVAVILALASIAVALFSRYFTADWMGGLLLKNLNFGKPENPFWRMGAGVAVLWTVFQIPFFGWLLSSLTMFTGIGGLVLKFMSDRETKRQSGSQMRPVNKKRSSAAV